MNGQIKFLLILLTILGFTVRLWRIDSIPFPPDGDEIAFGYYGWSLLNYQTDEFGNFLPLSFASIGDYKYPGLAYLNILPALLFGLSDFTTRFWSVISATFAIPLIFYLALFFTKNTRASIFSAFFFALSPWSIIESRLGYENHVSFVITLTGILCLFFHFGLVDIKIKNAKAKKRALYISLFLFSISIFTYAAQRFFVPSFLFVLFLSSFFNNEFKKHKKTIFLVLALATALSFTLSLNPKFRGRAGEEVWSVSQETLETLANNYHSAGISPVKIHPRLTWLLHNKYTYTFIGFMERYADHYSPNFLFFKGEASDENIPNMGLLLFAEIILLPLGIIYLTKNAPKRALLLIMWLLISPIPSALTKGGAHINRASLMLIPLCIFSGFGLYTITNLKARALNKFVSLFMFSFVLWSMLYALHQIFIVKPVLRPWYKQQVNKALTQKVLQLKDNYSAVAVTDDDYIFYLFYGRISPDEFQKNAEIVPSTEAKWERVDKLNNIYFKMPFRCPLSGKLDVLYVCEGDEIPQNSRLVDIVYYWDGLPAFTLIEFYPLSQRPSNLPQLPERLHYMVGVEKADGFPDGIIPSDYSSLW